MLKAAIIEDEYLIADRIEKQTKNFFIKKGEKIVVHRYEEGKGLIQALREGREIDFFLMDLQLPDINGIELMEKAREICKNIEVVVVTSYPEYAVSCIHEGVLDFVRKTKLEQELDNALEKVYGRMQEKEYRCFYIQNENALQKIYIHTILYLESVKRNVLFHCTDGEYSECRPLKEVYKRLPEKDFVYINNGQIVNLWYVAKIGGDTVLLENGVLLPVSRRRKKDIGMKMLAYIERRC